MITRLIFIAAMAALTAPTYAAAIGNKDCSHPLSASGLHVLESSPDYAAVKTEFTKALIAACKEGKSRDDIGFPAADELAGKAADHYVSTHDPKTTDPKAIRNQAGAIYNAWLGGYTGFDLPEDSKKKPARQPMNTAACEQLTKDAIQASIPPNVTITLEQYKKSAGQLGMICMIALQQGYDGKPRNNELLGSLSPEVTEMFNRAYDAGAAQ